jgi:hypothetical protein
VLRAFFGRHKSASTWARSILHDAAEALNLNIMTVHVAEQWAAYPSLGDMVRAEKPDLLIMTNAQQSDVDTLPEMRAFHIIRDPRDIVVSGYFSHLHSHPEAVGGIPWPELVEHRKTLKERDHDGGLFAEIEFSDLWFETMGSWNYHNPGVLELHMEDVISDPVKMWTLIFSHLDLLAEDAGDDRLRSAITTWNLAARRNNPRSLATLRRVLPRAPLRRLATPYVTSAMQRFSFSRLSQGRAPGEEDPTSHYRRGVAGDWRGHLKAEHLDAFRARYGDLVERLGYEW